MKILYFKSILLLWIIITGTDVHSCSFITLQTFFVFNIVYDLHLQYCCYGHCGAGATICKQKTDV